MRKVIQSVLDLRNSLNSPADYGYVSLKQVGEEIPKVIHQTFPFKGDALPEAIKENIRLIKEKNPGWEYKLYDDTDIQRYIKQYFPDLLEIYTKINPNYGAARADFFRYLLIYNEGGVYLDIKSNVSKPLDEIIGENVYLLSHWPRYYPKEMRGQHVGITNPIGELQQWHIMAVAGHPFLKAVIDNVCNNIKRYNPILHDFGAWGVVNLTGPIAYTEVIFPLLEQYPHRLEQDHLALGLVYSALDENDNKTGHHKVLPKTHYTKLTESIIKLTPWMQVLFLLSKPTIKFLKFTYNKYRS